MGNALLGRDSRRLRQKMIVCVGLAEHIHTKKDTLRSGILLKTKRIFFMAVR